MKIRKRTNANIVPQGYGSADRGLRERGRRPLDVHAGEAVQPDQLDQAQDLRLGAAQAYEPLVGPQPARQHREVEHERSVSERELAEVDDHVLWRLQRARERAAPQALSGPVL